MQENPFVQVREMDDMSHPTLLRVRDLDGRRGTGCGGPVSLHGLKESRPRCHPLGKQKSRSSRTVGVSSTPLSDVR